MELITDNGIETSTIKRLIDKFTNYYLKGNNLCHNDVKSEVGFAMLKALRSWNPNKENPASFGTYSNTVVKNHMSKFLTKEYKYKKSMCCLDDFANKDISGITAFELVSHCFCDKKNTDATVISKELISPSLIVSKTMRAIESKFCDYSGDLGDEGNLLKYGVHCFAISVAHKIPISRVVYIQRKLIQHLKRA